MEARAAGQLNHANILAIFDVGTHEGTPYIVSELLHGETLRQRLRGAAIPGRKAIEYAALIARALGAAHEKGIIHRDIKPENIFICADGQLKILDFGLARLSALADTGGDADSGETMTMEHRTAAGVILGSAAYMSPEQGRGSAVDVRSDIFSLGAVLYEMLSGRQAFSGTTLADILSSVLKDEPGPLASSIQGMPSIERIVRRCLAKNAAERFESARDLAFQLESLLLTIDSGSNVAVAAALGAAGSRSVQIGKVLSWLIAGALGCVLFAAIWWFHSHGIVKNTNRAVRFERLTDFFGMEESPALSPDGKSVAFVSESTGSRQIWVRLLAGGPALQLTNDAGEHLGPRWSADSASIFYYTPKTADNAQSAVWEISALGGSRRKVSEGISEVDASHDGKSLVFFRLSENVIQLVRTGRDGSNAQVIAGFPMQSGCHEPRWSPDDTSVAFILTPGRWRDDIFVVASRGGTPRQVTHDAFYLAGFSWLPDGSGFVYSSPRDSTLLYLPTEHLWRISLDGNSLKQLTFGDEGDESPDADAKGRIALSHKRINFDIWKIPVSGSPAENVARATRITHQTGQVQTPSVSPNNREIAYLSDTGGHGNIWILDLASKQTSQITFEKNPAVTLGVPLWSPDGSSIAYVRVDSSLGGLGGIEYWLINPDGSGNHSFFAKGSWFTWSVDGRWAYYSELADPRNPSSFRLMKKSVADGKTEEVRTDQALAGAPSSDGALFYGKTLQTVNGLSDYEIRVARPESGASSLLATIAGSRVPAWQGLHPVLSPNDKWLALTLNDKFGTNLWLLSAADGSMHAATDFGDQRIFIARHVSWSSDNSSIFAAVGDGDADIALLTGLLE